MSGVLQEPPSSSCSQTVAPVFLLTAKRKLRPSDSSGSLGPHQRIAKSRYKTGDEPLPNLCSHLPRSVRFQSSVPAKSKPYMPAEPKLTTTRSPSVTGEALPNQCWSQFFSLSS